MPEFATSVDIAASPDVVFDFLVTPEGLTAWMGERAVVNPHPGGLFEMDIAGSPIRGRYLEVVRPTRVVVSWGVLGSDDLPVGASTVTFALSPTSIGTRVDLTHADLPDPYLEGHADGWGHFLPRLIAAATGEHVPLDEWAPLPLRQGPPPN